MQMKKIFLNYCLGFFVSSLISFSSLPFVTIQLVGRVVQMGLRAHVPKIAAPACFWKRISIIKSVLCSERRVLGGILVREKLHIN